MNRVLTVALSEFLRLARSKAFIIGILLMPVLFGIMALFTSYAERHVDLEDRRLGVVDGTLDEIQHRHGQDTIRLRTAGGRATLAGMNGIESVTDHGNFQDVRVTGDPQAFLRALVQQTTVLHFEVTKPSLHDLFVRIAKPTAEDLRLAGETEL